MMKKTSPESIRSQVAALDAKRNQLMTKLREEHGIAGPQVKLWSVIQDYLTLNGGQADVEVMVGDLLAAKHDLGRYPLRTVKSCLGSPSCQRIFSVTSTQHRVKGQKTPITVERVTLRSLASQAAPYQNPFSRQHGRQAAAHAN